MKNHWLNKAEVDAIKYWENLGLYIDFSSVEQQSDKDWPYSLDSYGYYIDGIEIIAPTRDFSI